MNTFLNKVQAERKVLSTVNAYTRGKSQLAGLSGYAITNWGTANHIHINSTVYKSLTKLGDLCGGFSDRSNESFDKVPLDRLRKTEVEITTLKINLQTLFKAT